MNYQKQSILKLHEHAPVDLSPSLRKSENLAEAEFIPLSISTLTGGEFREGGLNSRITLRKKLVKYAQVSIEITFAFMVIFILFYTSAKIFVWFSDSLANRQMAYEDSRIVHDGAHQAYPRTMASGGSFLWWSWGDGKQVKEKDVGYVEDYLNDKRKPYYNAPLKLVE